jgi:hypothetical protein
MSNLWGFANFLSKETNPAERSKISYNLIAIIWIPLVRLSPRDLEIGINEESSSAI